MVKGTVQLLNCVSHVVVCFHWFNLCFSQRLKHWETRERKKLKEYEREKSKEDEKQEEMVITPNINVIPTVCLFFIYHLTICCELINHLMVQSGMP